MKKIFFYISIILVAFSCAKEQQTPDGASDDVFTASTPEQDKAYVDPANTMRWSANDGISVFCSSKNVKYEYGGPDSATKGSFHRADPVSATATYARYYAVYPYDSANECTASGNISVEISSVQHYADGRNNAGLMVAATESLSDRNLAFRNACGFIRLKLYNAYGIGVRKITLKGNNSEALAGKATVSLSNPEAPSTVMQESQNCIELDCGEGVTLGKTAQDASEFVIMVPPVNFTKGVTITVDGNNGNSFTKESSVAFSVSRNQIQPISPIEAGIEVTVINGTPILGGNNICGLITDKVTGDPVKDVVVTDCFHCTKTDANGVYQMKLDESAFNVSYSLPTGYKHPLKNGNMPDFYADGFDFSVVNRRDFQLVTDDNAGADFAFAVIGDVHIGSNIGTRTGESFHAIQCDRFRNVLLKSIVSTLEQGVTAGKYPARTYMTTVGDLTNNGYESQYNMYYNACKEGTQRTDGTYLPFYQVIGNHDHTTASVSTHKEHALLRKIHSDRFGPVNYSMNIGNAHIIFLDNAPWSNYNNMFEEDLNWIKEDLSYVSDKADKIVLLFAHVPLRGGQTYDHSGSQGGQNRQTLLTLLKEFNEAHIFTGHTHRTQNWVNSDYTTKSGKPVIEHIHGICGGHYWGTKICPDGTPAGSTIYTVRGNVLADSELNPMHYDTNYQMRVYNGNQALGSTPFHWYNEANVLTYPGSSIKNAVGNPVLQDSFVVTVWNSDIVDWKLEFWKNGEKVGDFSRPAETAETNPSLTGAVCDVFTSSWYDSDKQNGPNDDTFRRDTQHYFYFKAPGGDPASEQNWEVRAIHSIPGGETHTYTCTSFTTTYDNLYWE